MNILVAQTVVCLGAGIGVLIWTLGMRCYSRMRDANTHLTNYTIISGKDENEARTAFLHLMGLLAGKWPHTLAIQPGGTTRTVDTAEKLRLLGIVREFRRHLELTLYGGKLEDVAALDRIDSLGEWAGAAPGGDFRSFLRLAE